MEFIKNYLSHSLYVQIIAIGLFIIMGFHSDLPKKRTKIIRLIIIEILALSLIDEVEIYFRQFNTFQYERVIFSVLGYVMRPLIVYTLCSMFVRNRKVYMLLSIPLLVNTILYTTTLFGSKFLFYFTEENEYIGGFPSCMVVAFTYLLILIFYTFIKFKNTNIREAVTVLFMGLMIIISSLFEVFQVVELTLNTTIAIAALYYYIYLHIEHTKLDVGTQVMNRRAYVYDKEKYDDQIESIISVDMNNLKYVNDKFGHDEGDKALLAIGQSLNYAIDNKSFAYRTGGDEFIIISKIKDEDKLKEIINKIYSKLSETPYTVSIGYAIRNNNETVSELERLADKEMYIDKQKYKINR